MRDAVHAAGTCVHMARWPPPSAQGTTHAARAREHVARVPGPSARSAQHAPSRCPLRQSACAPQTNPAVKRFYGCLVSGEAYQDGAWQRWQAEHPTLLNVRLEAGCMPVSRIQQACLLPVVACTLRRLPPTRQRWLAEHPTVLSERPRVPEQWTLQPWLHHACPLPCMVPCSLRCLRWAGQRWQAEPPPAALNARLLAPRSWMRPSAGIQQASPGVWRMSFRYRVQHARSCMHAWRLGPTSVQYMALPFVRLRTGGRRGRASPPGAAAGRSRHVGQCAAARWAHPGASVAGPVPHRRLLQVCPLHPCWPQGALPKRVSRT